MLVEATLDHFESFYVLKCERTNIEWTGFSQAPSKDHFYNGILNNYVVRNGTFIFF